MLENLLNSISDNPAYLAVAIVLITMITISVIKKLFKIVTLGITLFILYRAYLLFTNQPLPNIDEIKTQLESSEEKIGDVIEDTVLDPLKEKTETITKQLEQVKKDLDLIVKDRVKDPQYLIDNLNDNDIKTLDAIIKTALRIKEIRANDIRNANKDNINELVDMVSVNNVQYQINNSKNLPIKSNKIA